MYSSAMLLWRTCCLATALADECVKFLSITILFHEAQSNILVPLALWSPKRVKIVIVMFTGPSYQICGIFHKNV